MFQVELNEVARPINHISARRVANAGRKEKYTEDVTKSLILKSKRFGVKWIYGGF
jgi:hypothetical protein